MRFTFSGNRFFRLISVLLVLLSGGCVSPYQQGKITAPQVGEEWAGK